MKIYRINAGYRKEHIGKNFYYVFAKTASMARSKFLLRIDYLEIYSIEECNPDDYNFILKESMKGRLMLFY